MFTKVWKFAEICRGLLNYGMFGMVCLFVKLWSATWSLAQRTYPHILGPTLRIIDKFLIKNKIKINVTCLTLNILAFKID